MLHVPDGVEDGTALRVPSAGASLPHHRSGDVLVLVRVAPHPRFVRAGADLHVRAWVEVADAVLGTELTVASLRGPLRVTVPPATQP